MFEYPSISCKGGWSNDARPEELARLIDQQDRMNVEIDELHYIMNRNLKEE